MKGPIRRQGSTIALALGNAAIFLLAAAANVATGNVAAALTSVGACLMSLCWALARFEIGLLQYDAEWAEAIRRRSTD